jgi:hypothetical protein
VAGRALTIRSEAGHREPRFSVVTSKPYPSLEYPRLLTVVFDAEAPVVGQQMKSTCRHWLYPVGTVNIVAMGSTKVW